MNALNFEGRQTVIICKYALHPVLLQIFDKIYNNAALLSEPHWGHISIQITHCQRVNLPVKHVTSYCSLFSQKTLT